jgi:hypothetical protein
VTVTDGAWLAPFTLTIPPETTRYGALTVSDDRDLFVLHAVLLSTGKVLMFSGHTEGMHYATVSFVFDPATRQLHRRPFPPGVDLFCCHYVHLEDGRVLVVGGSDADFNAHSSVGARHILFFDPTIGPHGDWVPSGQQLLQGRWYPTAVLLGDGRVLVFSGRREFGVTRPPADIAHFVEVLTPPTYAPTRMTGADAAGTELPIYPGMHLAPDGHVWYTHTNWGLELPDRTTRFLSVTGPTAGSWTDLGVHPAHPNREEGMSVLLPPAQDGKILVVGGGMALGTGGAPILQGGGGPNGFTGIANATDPFQAEILDTTITAGSPWSPTAGGGTTGHGRTNGHLVLLPDATVLACGGHQFYKWLDTGSGTTPSLVAEIYTPPGHPSGRAAGFRDVAAMTHPRMYHSTAMLLPDGRVLVTGGADANDQEPTLPWPAGWPANLRFAPGSHALNRKDAQLYEPPYFFIPGTRPTITEIRRNGARTRVVNYGETFDVETPQAADIVTVVLMRPGAPTHHTDTEQRYVPLTFTRAGNILTVTMLGTGHGSTLPPGYYMVWIVDNQQRPCQQAEFVRIPGPPRPVSSSSRWPCIVATVTMGSPDAPEVVTLRRVRHRIEGHSAGGRWLVAGVNRAYYSFSPQLAAWLADHDRARALTRSLVVRPVAALVGALERATDRLRGREADHV